jgi:hypothetical protein
MATVTLADRAAPRSNLQQARRLVARDPTSLIMRPPAAIQETAAAAPTLRLSLAFIYDS